MFHRLNTQFICCKMFIILLYFISFLFIHFACRGISNEQKRIQLETVICFMLLYVFFGFRGLSVLNDTAHYYVQFEELNKYNSFNLHSIFYIDPSERFEPGFLIYERVLAKISHHPYILINISALITTVCTLYFLRKNTNQISLVVFMLLCFQTLLIHYSAMRQGLATCLIYFAIELFLNKKRLVSILLIIIAFYFHKTSIVMLPLLIFYYIRLSKKNILYISLLSIFCASFVGIAFQLFYSYSVYYEEGLSRTSIALASILSTITTLIFCIIIYYNRNNIIIDKRNQLYIWFLILNISFGAISISFPVLARLSGYLSPYIIVLLINSVLNNNSVKIRNNFMLFITFFLLCQIIVVLLYKNEWYHIYPYSFFDFTQLYQQTDFGY